MKKLIGLSLALALFASCSDDDSSSSSSVNMDHLTKKWYPVTTTINGVDIPYDDHEECGNDYIEFIEGGVFKEVDVWDCEPMTDTGTYTVANKTITTVVDGYTEVATIKSLSSTKLVVTTEVEADPEFGTPAMTVKLTLKSSL
ncbi:lipocalin family protein [Flavobacterium sp.]|uniref:lipocalin family protein n=1 Tax=Flavobacterium sp. TaxID=239 RepID=UPI00403407BF